MLDLLKCAIYDSHVRICRKILLILMELNEIYLYQGFSHSNPRVNPGILYEGGYDLRYARIVISPGNCLPCLARFNFLHRFLQCILILSSHFCIH